MNQEQIKISIIQMLLNKGFSGEELITEADRILAWVID